MVMSPTPNMAKGPTQDSSVDYDQGGGWSVGGSAGRVAGKIFDPLQIGAGIQTPKVAYTGTAYDPGQFGVNQEFDQKTLARAANLQNAKAAPQATAATNDMGNLPQGQAAQTQGAQLATGPQNEMRGNQAALIQALQQQAAGKGGPSPAELQLQAGLQQQQAQANAMAHSQTGMSPAMAMHQALAAQNQAGLQTNQQQGILRAQEQQQAREALGGVLAGARTQDIGLAGQNAELAQQTGATNASLTQQMGLANLGIKSTATQQDIANQQQVALANLGATGAQNALNADMSKFYTTGAINEGEADRQAEIERAKIIAGGEQQKNQLETQVAMGNADASNKARGGLIGGIGAAIGEIFSDKRIKKNVKDAGKDVSDLLKALEPKSYEYKHTGMGDGRQYGIMAQDAEKTPAGRSMVNSTAGGIKTIDPQKGFGILLAALADHEKRISAMAPGARRA